MEVDEIDLKGIVRAMIVEPDRVIRTLHEIVVEHDRVLKGLPAIKKVRHDRVVKAFQVESRI